MRRKLTAMACVIVLALGLSACGGQGTGGGDAFTVRVVCQSEDVYQIFYTCYVGGESRGMGGMADLEGGELTEDTDLTLTFPRSYFEEGDDVGTFSMDFSPYGCSPPSGWTPCPTGRGTPRRSPPRTRWRSRRPGAGPTPWCSPATKRPASGRSWRPRRQTFIQ